MKILQKEMTGTQNSFSANFGGKLSFIRLTGNENFTKGNDWDPK